MTRCENWQTVSGKIFHPVQLFLQIVDDSGNIQLISTVTDDLVKEGINAGAIVKKIAAEIGGSGGGRPQLAQGGGTNLPRLKEIFENIGDYV